MNEDGSRLMSQVEGSPDERYEAFLSLFARDRERLFAFVFSLLPNHADAEDAFQRASVLLWRNFEAFDRERSFLAWACGVAANEVRNVLRSQRRDRLRFDDELVVHLAQDRATQIEEHDERFDALRSCLAALKPADCRLIEAAYSGANTLADYARSSGRAVQTLYNRLSQLRRTLLECVERKQAARERFA